MANCFALRFNCHKSGWDIPTNPKVFSALFDEDISDINECLKEYDRVNLSSFKEISKIIDMDILRNKFKNKSFLFMGDSMTSDRMSYEKIIELALPNQVTDCAVSGSRSINVASDISRCMANVKPDYVSLLTGGNDSIFIDKTKTQTSTSIEEYRRNLGIIADKVQSFGAKLIINSIAPVFSSKFNNDNLYWTASDENNSAFNEVAKDFAKEKGILFNDFRFVFETKNPEYMFEPDGIHPTPFAHRKIAETLLNTLLNSYI